MLLVLNNFIKNLLIVKSKDVSCDEDKWNDSKPYSDNGVCSYWRVAAVLHLQRRFCRLYKKLYLLSYKRIALLYQENI